MNSELLKKCMTCKIEKGPSQFLDLYYRPRRKCIDCRPGKNRGPFRKNQNAKVSNFLEEKLHSIHGAEVEAYTGYLFMEAIA